MRRLTGKLIAILLALWLPLFAGNVLAASYAMQSVSSDCNAAAVGAQHDASMHQHMHHGAHEMDAMQSDHQPSTHYDCGVCKFACSGYLTAATVGFALIQSPEVHALPGVMLFRSHIPDTLNPPPLVHA